MSDLGTTVSGWESFTDEARIASQRTADPEFPTGWAESLESLGMRATQRELHTKTY